MTSIHDYLDMFHALADRLLRTGTLDVPELIRLQSCSMLVAIAQKQGDLPGDAIDPAYLARVAEAVKTMRCAWASAVEGSQTDKAGVRWN